MAKGKEHVLYLLKTARAAMQDAADYMRETYGNDFINSEQLEGAANQVYEWIDAVKDEIATEQNP